MFNKILIANRGEIACRIIKTCNALGIQTVAIYSDVDRDALFVKQANDAFYVGPNPSRDSYLNIEKIIEIAIHVKVDAIHPGYGFLAENAAFAKSCEQRNIVWIGPPSAAILAMGIKNHAKKIMATAKVPLIPGYYGDNQEKDFLLAEAKKIGFPILIKPAAGGGGKGMRVVEQPDDFFSALESAIREAKSSFNHTSILLEKYLHHPRHIEIQIFADNHGNVVYLFERDCSLQRRHQKIIEEAPATHFSDETRKQMGEAAVRASKAIDYRGAGTLEFLYLDKHFYFMEMNTRLQVEHPVTEMIFGVDLVEWQIRIAAGEKLPLTQDQIKINGHAIEARIYAEDPEQNFMPSVGQLKHVFFPKTTNDIRIDTGVTNGSVISQFYDPMLAKVIVHAKNRNTAIQRLQRTILQIQLVGIKSNLSFLAQLLNNKYFLTANIHTQFIDTQFNIPLIHPEMINNKIYALAAAYLLLIQTKKKPASTYSDLFSPWQTPDHWRLFTKKEQNVQLICQDQEKTVHLTLKNHFFEIRVEKDFYQISGSINYPIFNAEINGHQIKLTIYSDDRHLYLNHPDFAYQLTIVDPFASYESEGETNLLMRSPMPGTVVAIHAQKGDKVNRGRKLIVIEAMKMEHAICAPNNGIITAVHYKVGDMVDEGVELLSFEFSEN